MSADFSKTVFLHQTGRVTQRAPRSGVRNEPGVLVSYTLPWREVSLIDFLKQGAGTPRVYWESDQVPVAFAGHGAAAVLIAAGPDRFDAIRQGVARLCDHAILEAVDAPPAASPRLFGGFSFQPDHTPTGIWAAFPAAYFVLPRYQLTRAEGRNWLTVNQLLSELPMQTRKFGTPPPPLHTGQLAAHSSRLVVRHSMNAATWRGLVGGAVTRIRRGELEKVVLARTIDVRADQPIQPVQIMERLKRRYPGCFRFLIEPVPGHAFCGATPELLVQVEGTTLRAVAMAGSTARGDSAETDAALARELTVSPKERQEHAFVVEAIEASLRPLVSSLHVPERPILRRLPNIQHLQTIIRGELADGVGVWLAVEALHPTPAVGGVPRSSALRLITDAEPVPRGWYASPVGWVDLRGEGMFNVAIRSAVSVGVHARLYAGAGIVAGSDPDREWDETRLKFLPMLQALGRPVVG